MKSGSVHHKHVQDKTTELRAEPSFYERKTARIRRSHILQNFPFVANRERVLAVILCLLELRSLHQALVLNMAVSGLLMR
jgi:hypothetical protein